MIVFRWKVTENLLQVEQMGKEGEDMDLQLWQVTITIHCWKH